MKSHSFVASLVMLEAESHRAPWAALLNMQDHRNNHPRSAREVMSSGLSWMAEVGRPALLRRHHHRRSSLLNTKCPRRLQAFKALLPLRRRLRPSSRPSRSSNSSSNILRHQCQVASRNSLHRIPPLRGPVREALVDLPRRVAQQPPRLTLPCRIQDRANHLRSRLSRRPITPGALCTMPRRPRLLSTTIR